MIYIQNKNISTNFLLHDLYDKKPRSTSDVYVYWIYGDFLK